MWAEFLQRAVERRRDRGIPAELGPHAQVIIAATTIRQPSIIVWLKWAPPGVIDTSKGREMDVCFTVEEARESAADVMKRYGVSHLVDFTLPDGDWPAITPWPPEGGS